MTGFILLEEKKLTYIMEILSKTFSRDINKLKRFSQTKKLDRHSSIPLKTSNFQSENFDIRTLLQAIFCFDFM